MSGRHRLSKVAIDLNKIKQDEIIEIPGELGLKLGGQRLVEVPNRLGFYYVRLRNDQSEVVQAFNDKVSPVYGLPVIVVRDKVDKGRYYIKSRDTGRYAVWGSSPYLPLHGAMHSFNPELPGADIVWTYSQQFTPLLAVPSGSSAGMNVVIYPGSIYYGTRWIYFGVTGTAAFDQYKPTGTNQARMVLITLNSAGNPVLTPGNYFAADTTGTQQIYDQIPSVPSSSITPIAAVRLVSGTSYISWENLYDLRQFYPVSTGTLFGVGGGGGHGIYNGNVLVTQRGNLVFSSPEFSAFKFYDDSGNDKTIISGGWPGHRIYNSTTKMATRGNLVFAIPGLTSHDVSASDNTVISGSSIGHRILGNGVGFTRRDNLNFVGAGLVVYDDSTNGRTVVSGTASGGVTDHGALTGLLDNDHPQYLLTGTAIPDEKVKVSSNDTTPGYLNGKLVAGPGVTFTELNDGSNETLRITATGTAGGSSLVLNSYQTAFADENGYITGSNFWRTYNIPSFGDTYYPITVLGARNSQVPPPSNHYFRSYALNVVQSDQGGVGGVGIYGFSGSPELDFFKAGGSETGVAVTQNGDFLGGIYFAGISEPYDPPYYDNSVRILGLAEQDFDVSSGAGGSLSIAIVPTGSFGYREMIRIRGTRIDFTGTSHFHGDYIEADGDLRLGSGSAIYLGSPTQDGSWRLRRDANNLVYERRESSSWVLKQTISA